MLKATLDVATKVTKTTALKYLKQIRIIHFKRQLKTFMCRNTGNRPCHIANTYLCHGNTLTPEQDLAERNLLQFLMTTVNCWYKLSSTFNVNSVNCSGAPTTVVTLILIFTALHGMQSRYSNGNSVCLSRWSEIADFESIIARSASAVGLRPSEKSSINIKVRISDSEAQNYAQKFTKNIIIHETPFRLTHHL